MDSPTSASQPFSTGEARAAGLTKRQLARLLARGELVRIGRGLYGPLDASSMLSQSVQHRASLSSTALVAAHTTAAAIHGLRTPRSDDRLFFVCDRTMRHPDYLESGLVILPAKVGDADITVIDGLRVTTLERTALDLARGCTLEYALVPIDHALTLGATRQSLQACRARMKGWPGTRVLDQALAVANPLAESALESMSRGSILRAGLPSPDLQRTIVGNSSTSWRADFLWPDARVVGEADGHGKYASRGQHEKEKFRDGDLAAAGWTVVHWTFEQMLIGQRPALRWLERALGVRMTADPSSARTRHYRRPPHFA